MSAPVVGDLITEGMGLYMVRAALIRVWPRWIRITPAGVAEWERIVALKAT